MSRLLTLIDDLTTQFRKGPQVTEKMVGNVKVTDVYMMDPVESAPPELVKIDVHFVIVGVDAAKAMEHRAELADLIKTDLAEAKLERGPSYIAIGAILGSQDMALRLMALGEVLNFWKVLTPARLHITGPQADEMAGLGYVMVTGFWPEGIPTKEPA